VASELMLPEIRTRQCRFPTIRTRQCRFLTIRTRHCRFFTIRTWQCRFPTINPAIVKSIASERNRLFWSRETALPCPPPYSHRRKLFYTPHKHFYTHPQSCFIKIKSGVVVRVSQVFIWICRTQKEIATRNFLQKE